MEIGDSRVGGPLVEYSATLLRIHLLGGVRLQRTGAPSSSRLTRKLQGLLAYLVLHRTRRHSRDAVAALFWGDAPEPKARSCLSTALWRLRKVLEPDGVERGTYLVARPSGPIGFNADSPYWLDVERLEREAAALRRAADADSTAELEEAVRLYRGDLLEGWYDDWALREQERVRMLYLGCLRALMRRQERNGDVRKALDSGMRILARDPLREEIHRAVIGLHLAAGERSLALRQYERCRRLLAAELDIEPMPETRALVARWLRDASPDGAGAAGADHTGQALLVPLERASAALDQARRQVEVAMSVIRRGRRGPSAVTRSRGPAP